MTMKSIERYKGALLGLATGDALGTTLEFKSPGTFEPIEDIVGGGPFGLKAGQWTDDTSMALCLAESLIERKDFDPRDQVERYVRWWRKGHLSSTGECFDIGGTTSSALTRFENGGDPYAGIDAPNTAGNGSIMRLAPVPLFFAEDPEKGIKMAAESSLTTHGAETCVDACRYLAALIVGAVRGAGKDELLSTLYTPVPNYWQKHPLCEEIDAIAAGSFRNNNPPQIKGTGYVVKSLEAALWAFYHSTTFRDGALLAVNLGDDADTTGAVYGQLAGAHYGVSGIPQTWLSLLAQHDLIEDFAERIHSLSFQKRAVRPVGFARFSASPWKSPDIWASEDIPDVPGMYEVRCLDSSGAPLRREVVALPGWDSKTLERLQRVAKETCLEEVLYIGKAASIKQRFGERLVPSWWSGKLPGKLHDSRITWEDSSELQKLYPQSGIECRYIPIGSKSMKVQLSELAQEFSDLLGWTEDDARKTSLPTPAAVMAGETYLMLKYMAVFGDLPPLNRKGPDRPGAKLTTAWVLEHFGEESKGEDDGVLLEKIDYDTIKDWIEQLLRVHDIELE